MKISFTTGDSHNEIEISGAINERTEEVLVAHKDAFHAANVNIRCSGVESINSIGISHWVHYFTTLDINPVISFYEVPEILMDAAQTVRHFFGSGAVKSFYVTGNCEACDAYTRKLFQSEELKSLEDFPPVPCDKCNQSTELDEELGDYKAVLAFS